jgi:hypothetical protein
VLKGADDLRVGGKPGVVRRTDEESRSSLDNDLRIGRAPGK